MSSKDISRRTDVEVFFDGVNISKSLRKYFISMTYTDCEEDEADDLQILIEDRNEVWLTKWLNNAIQAAASTSNTVKGLKIEAAFIQKNWAGDGKDKIMDCGQFELDSIEADGPPSSIMIKGTALPFNSQARQTKKSKAWESYYLSKIAKEIALENGMTCMYESEHDPYYQRVEQITTSDIAFLSTLCHAAGISLKVFNNFIILFDQANYEKKPSILTITRGAKGGYTRYKIRTGEADQKYAACRVSYVNPSTGKAIQGMAYAEDYDPKNKRNQTLEIQAKVSSTGEAQALAQKYLRLKNKYEYTATFTVPGNPDICAGVTIRLSGWGAWDGKYIVKQASHILSSTGGYTTQIRLRHVLAHDAQSESSSAKVAGNPGIKVGSKVKVKPGAKNYSGVGLASFVYKNVYDVIQIKGERVVIGINGQVTAAMRLQDLILQ